VVSRRQGSSKASSRESVRESSSSKNIATMRSPGNARFGGSAAPGMGGRAPGECIRLARPRAGERGRTGGLRCERAGHRGLPGPGVAAVRLVQEEHGRGPVGPRLRRSRSGWSEKGRVAVRLVREGDGRGPVGPRRGRSRSGWSEKGTVAVRLVRLVPRGLPRGRERAWNTNGWFRASRLLPLGIPGAACSPTREWRRRVRPQ
jgi:hypothetical protein